MNNTYRNGPNRGAVRPQNGNNRSKFNNLRKNHQIQNQSIPSLRIINRNGQDNRPVKILTARKANQQAANGRAAKIAKNLQHMQQAAEKKRQAQELYYGNGQSPMVRSASNNNPKPQNNNAKGSVQQRLGNNRKPNLTTGANRPNFNQGNRNNAVNRNIGNKNNVNRSVNRVNVNREVNNRVNRKPFVPNVKQAKINRIQNYGNNKIQNRLKNPNFGNQQKTVKTVNPLTGEVKYLRPLRQNKKTPPNYTVCVENSKPNFRPDNLFNGMSHKHHVSSDLNPAIQQEIRMLQNKAYAQIGIAQPFPIPQPIIAQPLVAQGLVAQVAQDARVPIMATRTTLHERFSKI